MFTDEIAYLRLCYYMGPTIYVTCITYSNVSLTAVTICNWNIPAHLVRRVSTVSSTLASSHDTKMAQYAFDIAPYVKQRLEDVLWQSLGLCLMALSSFSAKLSPIYTEELETERAANTPSINTEKASSSTVAERSAKAVVKDRDSAPTEVAVGASSVLGRWVQKQSQTSWHVWSGSFQRWIQLGSLLWAPLDRQIFQLQVLVQVERPLSSSNTQVRPYR